MKSQKEYGYISSREASILHEFWRPVQVIFPLKGVIKFAQFQTNMKDWEFLRWARENISINAKIENR